MNRMNLFFIGVLFFSTSAFASSGKTVSKLNFKCITENPTTSFLLKTEGDEAVLTTVHHNGTQFMPIHEGIIVPHDINYLIDKSRFLTKMGERNEFRFPLTECRVYGKSQMSCVGGNTQTFDGTEMQGLMLSTSLLSEKAFGETYNRLKVTLSVNITGYVPVQDLSINYSGKECTLDF